MKKTLADYWAPRINAEWRKSVEGIIGVGQRLIEAKAACEHGEFVRLFKGTANAVPDPVPFGIHTADRLMAIASKPALADCAHAHTLPQSWATLYELTHLDDATIEAGIQAGEITPHMTRSQAAQLRADPIARDEPPLFKAEREIENAVTKHTGRLSVHDRLLMVRWLRRLARDVECSVTYPMPGTGRLNETTLDRLRVAGVIKAADAPDEIVRRLQDAGMHIVAEAVISEMQEAPPAALTSQHEGAF